MALGLLASACSAAPASSMPARTAVPMWTLPFVQETTTPGPSTQPPGGASPTPAGVMAAVGDEAALLSTEAAHTPGVVVVDVEPNLLPTESAPTQSPTEPTPDSPPRLMIPDLKLDHAVESMGIVDGDWDLAHLGDEVGWLTTTGRHPGDNLAVVLVGHVTTAPGKYGPFAGIGQLPIDAQVIYRWAGQDYVYAVRGMKLTDISDIQQLYVPDGGQLLLVTCYNYNFLSGEYQQRLIVTTEWIGTLASQ
jgi:LPXTG-site transpeptidase (sortase) family protein